MDEWSSEGHLKMTLRTSSKTSGSSSDEAFFVRKRFIFIFPYNLVIYEFIGISMLFQNMDF